MQKEKFIPKTQIVFCSKLKRAKQCISKSIRKNKNLKIIHTRTLNEIPFDLKLYSSKVTFEKEGSVAVRKTFKKLFIEDKLMIKRSKIFKEIEELLKNIKSKYSSEKSVTLLSHSFKLKCIEAYLKTKGRIIKHPKLLEKHIKNNQKTFNFGEGFDFEI